MTILTPFTFIAMNIRPLSLALFLAGLLGLGCSSEPQSFDDTMMPPARFATQTSSTSAAPRVDGLRFRRYTEQREQAYAFEAPEGWNVQAQVIRKSPTVYRVWNTIASPDGDIRISGGLPERFLFMEPSQMTQMMGLREGATPDGNVYVARYQPAAVFAQQNIQAITGGCGTFQITGQQDRPDEAQRQEAKARSEGDWVNGARVNAAELMFTCQGPNGPVEGRVIAATIRIEVPGTGTTWLGSLRGYLASPDRTEDAYRIMEHSVQSHQTNPQWKAHQRQAQQAQMQANQRNHQQWMRTSQQAHQQRMARNQTAFNAHQQRMADQQATFDSYNQSWQANQATQDRLHDQFIGTIREETRVWDTNSGEYYDVPYGSDNYYIDNTGSTIIGTPGYVDNPDPGTYNQMYEGYDYPEGDNNW